MIDTAGLLSSINLPGLIASHVRLRRSGHRWFGICPFHAEKTGSLMVEPDHFHCFGCDAHGDAIDWVMRSERLSFLDACARLGGRELTGEEKAGLSRERKAADRERRAAKRRASALTAYRDRNPCCACPDWLLDFDDAAYEPTDALADYLSGR